MGDTSLILVTEEVCATRQIVTPLSAPHYYIRGSARKEEAMTIITGQIQLMGKPPPYLKES